MHAEGCNFCILVHYYAFLQLILTTLNINTPKKMVKGHTVELKKCCI